MARILVIDDDEHFRRYLRTLLERAGHRVMVASDGDLGLRAIANDPSDLVVCDILMPEKDGLETIRELHRSHPNVKIVAVSGGSAVMGIDFLKDARAFGANAVLPKPFQPEDFLSLLGRLLGEVPQAS
jgi:CheY-like chemotaxis protein